MAPPSPVALFKCPAFAAQSRSVLDGLLSSNSEMPGESIGIPRLIRPPLVLTQSRSLSKSGPAARRRFFSMPPRLSSRCENRVVLVRKSVHCGRTGRQTALVTKSFQPPKPSQSNSIPQRMKRLRYVHAPSDQERSAGAFHRSGRRKAQGRRTRERTFNVIGRGSENVLLDQLRAC